MENATIVTLGSANFAAPASTFEQEFSEARGRGRARRQKRKMERISNRKTSRKARQDMRLDKKRSRVEARNERKTMRSDNREQRKTQKSQGKLNRERAELEQEREFTPEDEPEENYDQESDSPQQDQSEYSEDQGYENETSNDDDGYSEDQGYSEEEGDYDEGESEFTSDTFNQFNDSEGETPFDYADGSGTAEITPMLQDVANRVEWNKELCCRIKDKATNGQMNPQNAKADIDKAIMRIKELNSCMDAYCKFEGEFVSDANGMTSFNRCDPPSNVSKEMKLNRVKTLKTALANAQNSRKRSGSTEQNTQRTSTGSGRRAVNRSQPRPMQNVTDVEMGLSPRISNQKIVVPAQSNADGGTPTGVIGLDNSNDFDASSIDIKLGADGKTESKSTKMPIKPILIGIGVGLVVMVALKKFKVL